MIKKIVSTILGLGINIVIYAVAIFVLIRVGTVVYDFSYDVFGAPVVNENATEEIRVEVVSGDGGKTMATKLKSAGLIEDELAFSIKARLSSSSLMPGTYVLKASMSADEMLTIMSDQANSVVVQKTAEELEAETAETDETQSGDAAAETSEGESGQ